MPTPEVTEKLAREIAQSYFRQLSDDASYEKEFQYRAGIRRAVTIMYGYKYEHKLSDVVANLSRETVFGSK